jgi:hypothetical protein
VVDVSCGSNSDVAILFSTLKIVVADVDMET